MANRILQKRNGWVESYNKRVSAALLPGTLCVVNSSGQYAAAAADSDRELLYVLDGREYLGQANDQAYTAGDSGIAYEVQPERTFQIRAAAGTYGVNAKLTCAANGYVGAAGANDSVIGYHDGDASVTATAGDLIFVRIAQGK